MDLQLRVALSPPEAAETIGVSESWLRDAMRNRGLPFSRIGGRVFIQPRKLAAWLDEHEERTDALARALAAMDRRAADRSRRGESASDPDAARPRGKKGK